LEIITEKDHHNSFLISILIVTYNNATVIQKCLNSIYKSKFSNFEVIIVDSNSTDNTLEAINNLECLNIRLFRYKKNLGYALGINFAASKAKSPYLLIINPDIIFQDDFLENFFDIFLKLMKKNKKLIISPQIIEPNRIFNTGSINILGFGLMKQLDENQIKKIQETDFISGCCLLISKENFFDLSGFERRFFIYYEDIFLSLKAKLLGYRLFVINSSRIYHLKRTKNKNLQGYKYYFVERNRLISQFLLTDKKFKTFRRQLFIEPIMLIHAILTKKLKYRARLYIDVKAYLNNYFENNNFKKKVNFDKYCLDSSELLDFIEMKNISLKSFLKFLLKICFKVFFF